MKKVEAMILRSNVIAQTRYINKKWNEYLFLANVFRSTRTSQSKRMDGKKTTSKKRKSTKEESTRPKKKQRQNLKFQPNTLRGGPESKNLDVAGSVSSNLGAFVTPLVVSNLINLIGQGATENNRIGRKVTMTSLMCRWAFDGSADTVAQGMRIFVFYDKQPNGAFPNITDVLTSSSHTGLMNLNNADRFIVLHDELVNEMAITAAPIGSFYVKMNLDSVYQSNGGTVADFATGAIYIAVANSTSTTRTLSFRSRVRYYDS